MEQIQGMGPKISEPTDVQISSAIREYKKKYDIFIPKADVENVLKLKQKLEWWSEFDPSEILSRPISKEIAEWIQKVIKNNSGKDLSLDDIRQNARQLLGLLPIIERNRAIKEIRTILIGRRMVSRNIEVENKVSKLFDSRYGMKLSAEDFDQLIPNLSRNLWFSEGLDASLDKCLDDLLSISNVGSDHNCVHDKFIQTIDAMSESMKLTKNGSQK